MLSPDVFNKAMFEAVVAKIDTAPGSLTNGDITLLQAFGGTDLVTRAVEARWKALQPPAPVAGSQTHGRSPMTAEALGNLLVELLSEFKEQVVRPGFQQQTARIAALETQLAELRDQVVELHAERATREAPVGHDA